MRGRHLEFLQMTKMLEIIIRKFGSLELRSTEYKIYLMGKVFLDFRSKVEKISFFCGDGSKSAEIKMDAGSCNFSIQYFQNLAHLLL